MRIYGKVLLRIRKTMHVCGLSQFQNSKSEATSHEEVRAGTFKKVVSKVGYELHYPTVVYPTNNR